LSRSVVPKDNHVLLHVNGFQKERSGQFKWFHRPGSSVRLKLNHLATQKIAGRQVTSVAAPGKNDARVLDRGDRKAWMQTKAKVRGPFGLFIVEREAHVEAISGQGVTDSKRDLSRIFDGSNLAGSQRVNQSAFVPNRDFWIGKPLVPQEAVI